MKLINTSADLNALRGTPAFREALLHLNGASTILVDVAVRPSDYGEASYEGPAIEPVWEAREDNASLDRLGMTRSELAAELAAP